MGRRWEGAEETAVVPLCVADAGDEVDVGGEEGLCVGGHERAAVRRLSYLGRATNRHGQSDKGEPQICLERTTQENDPVAKETPGNKKEN